MNDNLVEYQHPELYDLEQGDFEPEGPFLLRFAAQYGSPILDLGCGTGRFAIPLARQGYQLTGVDLVPAMIELARKKAGQLCVQWIQADIRTLSLHQKFRLIYETGSVFQHMLNRADQIAYLSAVRAHLHPEGAYIVGLYHPERESLETNQGQEVEWFRYSLPYGGEVVVTGIDHFDPEQKIQTEVAIRRWTDEQGIRREHRAPLSLKITADSDMEEYLKTVDLFIVEKFNGWDHSPWSAGSPFTVFVIKPQPA